MWTFGKTNTALLFLIIAVNGYVILTPILPVVAFYSPGTQVRQKTLAAKVAATTKPEGNQQLPNSVIIPAMLLDKPVLEGRNTYKVLNQGILRWPVSSTPDKGGNTVLLAHRFTYNQPQGMFYYLDKLKQGDQVGMMWNNKRYTYTVDDVRVVKPTEVSILANTTEPRLTLFTCTPLLWPKDRLVVTATQTWPRPEARNE